MESPVLSLCSEDEQPSVQLWGCELSSSNRSYVFTAAEDLLEHLLKLKTICLSVATDDQLTVVAATSKNVYGSLTPVPIASLRSSVLPMISLAGLEFVPPVTFVLLSGSGPVYISGLHLALEEDTESNPEMTCSLSVGDDLDGPC
uniref:Nucleoplasmin core domain-containing protein n=1 Tax=Ornithorhynchus anatinus TaxID=9258 RepID=A0A6I8N931_ORNAN